MNIEPFKVDLFYCGTDTFTFNGKTYHNILLSSSDESLNEIHKFSLTDELYDQVIDMEIPMLSMVGLELILSKPYKNTYRLNILSINAK